MCSYQKWAEQEQSDHKSTENSFFVETTENPNSENEKKSISANEWNNKTFILN